MREPQFSGTCCSFATPYAVLISTICNMWFLHHPTSLTFFLKKGNVWKVNKLNQLGAEESE